MAAITKKPPAKRAPRSKATAAAATLRSTSGAGFEFEDLISASHLVKALSGELVPDTGHGLSQLQAQVSTLGWAIDDLLLTAGPVGAPRRLAISAKGNVQVSAAGLPKDFVVRAWQQWRDKQGPFNPETDGLALVTLGIHPGFEAAWREVKNACSGSDTALAMSRIRANKKQSTVFNSVQEPGAATDEDTIQLIRRLQVLPNDLQYVQSEAEAHSIALCRGLLTAGRDVDAQELWNAVIGLARGVRLKSGTITLPEVLSSLRRQFDLRHHPDFRRDWTTLSNITADHKARIETELPSGYALPRDAERSALQAALAESLLTVVFGESGSGKSALVKSVLDDGYPGWNQVWFGPEDLKTALSASRRSTLPLAHELSLVLSATVKPQNVLVIDSAERIEPGELIVVRKLLQAILQVDGKTGHSAWRVVIVTQPHSWATGDDTAPFGQKARLMEVEPLKPAAVSAALQSSPALRWLTAHDETIAALTNLRTLAWFVQAGAGVATEGAGPTSHTDIADRLWKHWTSDREDVQAFVMRLAQREASFERSFALTGLEPLDAATFAGRPAQLPLRLNQRTNRIEFEHDLAADWARFQYLKQIWADTQTWAGLANNPLWTNALRMLGQFLLRQPTKTQTAWDVAFEQAEAAENPLAGDILLDALCLDPRAEGFLNERAELLLRDNEKNLSRLLTRFHHIATVPTGSNASFNAVGLYMEAKYRSIVVGRWPPVLRFIIAQRDRFAGIVSSALATVIETWLTKTPTKFNNGDPVPFRAELAQIALAMARTVQAQKGHGVMYLSSEPALYTAPLAGVADLPTEIGNWALELAGRRDVDDDVRRRIAEVRARESKEHADRMKTDPAYKARYEERSRVLPSLSSMRKRLPPWPLGAMRKVDMDFQKACLDAHGLQPLMRALPDLASEVLLALIIEDEPERDYGRSNHEISLGLDYPRDMYPTAFWKGPFFPFFHIAPATALGTVIALVNFCTERWVAEVKGDRDVEPPAVILRSADGSEKVFAGWWRVFDWPQSNDATANGNLYCALDALERWLTLRLEAGGDVTSDVERLLREGNSAAIVSVLVNVAKSHPALLRDSLSSLISFPNLFFWDVARVRNVNYNFVAFSWIKGGEAMFNLARDWALAPHRKKTLVDVAVDLMLADDGVAQRLQALIPTWKLPDAPKEALEFKLLFATLDRDNYSSVSDPNTGVETKSFVCPAALREELESWQADSASALEHVLVPDQCEQLLQRGTLLNDREAVSLFQLLQRCGTEKEDEDESLQHRCRFATASTLVALGSDWLARNPEALQHAFEVVRAGVADVPSTANALRERRNGVRYDELKFVAHAAMRMWLANGPEIEEWETAVLRLLTSGDRQAATVIVDLAYTHRDQLGNAWWRLLRVGLFWSGLSMLAPRHGAGERDLHTWERWLARLRRLSLRDPTANPEQLSLSRVVAGLKRLDFRSRMREYKVRERKWLGKPKRDRGLPLDSQILDVLFSWLIGGAGTGDRELDVSLATRIWNYDATRAKARREDRGEYDLPSQSLGYNVLQKLAALSTTPSATDGREVWEPVLTHGPAAHYALRHFISSFFLSLGQGSDPTQFERVWRAMAEYGLAANWSRARLWFYGERLLGELLGFGNERALLTLSSGAALRMKDLYERWADAHLHRDDDNLTNFSYFLASEFAAPMRLDGICWIAAMLRKGERAGSWRREETGNELLELVAVALGSDAQALSRQPVAQQALVEIAAALAAKNIPMALALQERIRQLK